jgi:hypothetical protein
MHRAQQMSPPCEQVVDDAVDTEKPLGLRARFEAPHLALALAGRLVGDLGAIVRVARCIVADRGHDDPMRGAVAPEAIGHETVRDSAAPLEQLAKESCGGVAIPMGLEQCR